jgi:hypothetical protein
MHRKLAFILAVLAIVIGSASEARTAVAPAAVSGVARGTPITTGNNPEAIAITPDGKTAISVDGTSAGRTFDGIGAISAGGGNSRLAD